MGESMIPDLEGYFEPAEVRDHLGEPQLIPEAIAEQQLRRTYWRLSFERVQFGAYNDKPACLLVVEARFAPEDRRRHRFTRAVISLEFEGEERGDVKVEKFAPEVARGITVPELHTSNWAINPKISLSVASIPINIDIFDGRYGHTKSYQIDRTARMEGVGKGRPERKEVKWSLTEASQEGIPLRIPSLVVLVTHKAGRPFKIKFGIDASIGLSLNPQRWSIFAKPLQPISLDDTMQLIPSGNHIDQDFTTLDM